MAIIVGSTHLQQSHQQHYGYNYGHHGGDDSIDEHTATSRHTDSAVGASLHTCGHGYTTLGADYHRLILGVDIVGGCTLIAHILHYLIFSTQRYYKFI